MKTRETHGPRKFNFASMGLLLLFFCIATAGTSFAQKKPTALDLDANADDKQLCNGPLSGSQFCDYRSVYNQPGATEAQRRAARNEMIQLVRGQVDTYYKLRKDGRKTKLRWLQTLLDFLEVGAATSIAIMNGERARGVVGAALSGFQGGRTAFNRNFEVLQTQVLINKMNSNRAEIFTEIIQSSAGTTAEYSWYAAKNDLRRYLFAGTFNNALDSLVDETGAAVDQAERGLRLAGEVSAAALRGARNANQSLNALRAALADPATSAVATTTLRAIVTAISANDEVAAALSGPPTITNASEGDAIRRALITIRGRFLRDNRDDLVILINQTIVDVTAERMP